MISTPCFSFLPKDIDTSYQKPSSFKQQMYVHVYIQTINQSKTVKSNRLAKPTCLFFTSKTVVVTLNSLTQGKKTPVQNRIIADPF